MNPVKKSVYFFTISAALISAAGCASSERMMRLGMNPSDYRAPSSKYYKGSSFEKGSDSMSKRVAPGTEKPLEIRYDDTLVNFWPFFLVNDKYTSVLWPFIDKDQYGMAVRPFYNREGDERSILFPLSGWNAKDGDGWALLGYWDSRKWGVFPFMKVYDDRNKFSYVFNAWRDSDTSFGFFPFARFARSVNGTNYLLNMWWNKETAFGFFPLARFANDPFGTNYVLNMWWDIETVFGFFPLAKLSRLRDDTSYILNMWWGGETAFGFFPLARFQRDGDSFIIPLYSYQNDGKDSSFVSIPYIRTESTSEYAPFTLSDGYAKSKIEDTKNAVMFAIISFFGSEKYLHAPLDKIPVDKVSGETFFRNLYYQKTGKHIQKRLSNYTEDIPYDSDYREFREKFIKENTTSGESRGIIIPPLLFNIYNDDSGSEGFHIFGLGYKKTPDSLDVETLFWNTSESTAADAVTGGIDISNSWSSFIIAGGSDSISSRAYSDDDMKYYNSKLCLEKLSQFQYLHDPEDIREWNEDLRKFLRPENDGKVMPLDVNGIEAFPAVGNASAEDVKKFESAIRGDMAENAYTLASSTGYFFPLWYSSRTSSLIGEKRIPDPFSVKNSWVLPFLLTGGSYSLDSSDFSILPLMTFFERSPEETSLTFLPLLSFWRSKPGATQFLSLSLLTLYFTDNNGKGAHFFSLPLLTSSDKKQKDVSPSITGTESFSFSVPLLSGFSSMENENMMPLSIAPAANGNYLDGFSSDTAKEYASNILFGLAFRSSGETYRQCRKGAPDGIAGLYRELIRKADYEAAHKTLKVTFSDEDNALMASIGISPDKPLEGAKKILEDYTDIRDVSRTYVMTPAVSSYKECGDDYSYRFLLGAGARFQRTGLRESRHILGFMYRMDKVGDDSRSFIFPFITTKESKEKSAWSLMWRVVDIETDKATGNKSGHILFIPFGK